MADAALFSESVDAFLRLWSPSGLDERMPSLLQGSRQKRDRQVHGTPDSTALAESVSVYIWPCERDLKETDGLRVLDNNEERAFKLFRAELRPPIMYEPVTVDLPEIAKQLR